MPTIPILAKRISLIAALSLGAVGAFVLPASAHYTTERCDRDGDDCVRMICDDDGDDCRPVEHYHVDNQPRYTPAPAYNPWAYSLGFGLGYDRGEGGHYWRGHDHHHEDDDDD